MSENLLGETGETKDIYLGTWCISPPNRNNQVNVSDENNSSLECFFIEARSLNKKGEVVS